MIRFIIEWGIYLNNRFFQKPTKKESKPKGSYGSCMIALKGMPDFCECDNLDERAEL